MALRFKFSEEKALEALCLVARKWPSVTPFYVAKIIFYAEKRHLNAYGRPIVADTFIAMNYGPVPSTVRDFIEGSYLFLPNADDVGDAIEVKPSGRYRGVTAKREPRHEMLSQTDVECLLEAIELCRPNGHAMNFSVLSEMTHRELAWINAGINQPMDYEDFIDADNPHRDEIIERAHMHAAHGVL